MEVAKESLKPNYEYSAILSTILFEKLLRLASMFCIRRLEYHFNWTKKLSFKMCDAVWSLFGVSI